MTGEPHHQGMSHGHPPVSIPQAPDAQRASMALTRKCHFAAECVRSHLAKSAPRLCAALPPDDSQLVRWLQSLLTRAATRVSCHPKPYDALAAMWEEVDVDPRSLREGQALVSALVAALSGCLGGQFDRQVRLAWTCACNVLVAETLSYASLIEAGELMAPTNTI